MVKIGVTKGFAEVRRRHYVKTHSLVGDYRVIKEWVDQEGYKRIEANIHRLLARRRVTNNMRELYRMEVAEALAMVEDAIAAHRREFTTK